MPKLSIIVPVYNTEKYLEECIESILRQSLRDIEIILVDDGSTDRSGEICDQYEKRDERITVLHKENGGLSDARNAGLYAAEADCVGFVDSDDTVSRDFFWRLYERMIQENADIAVAGIRQVDEEGRIMNVRCVKNDVTLNRHDGLQELLYSKRISNSVCNKIFRKKLFCGISFPKGKLYEDEFVTYRLFEKADKITILRTEFYDYRSNPKSITHQAFSEREFDRIEASEQKIQFCRERYPDLLPYVEYYLVYDCACALAKMKQYKKSYDPLVRKNMRKYWKSYIKGDNSIAAKLYVLLACCSPKLTVGIWQIVKKSGVRP